MKTVVLGAGRMGRRHVQAVRELGLDIVGVADLSPEALGLTEREQGVAASLLSTDPAGLLERTRPEVVVVATTAPSHAPLSCLAAERGARFILCEKPFATSLEACDRTIAACAKASARLAVNHSIRFNELYTEPKRLMATAEFGGLKSVVVATGNIGLAMNGTHYFEALRFLTGEAPASVSAILSDELVANPRGAEFRDHGGTIVVRTASGKRLVLECGPDQGHGSTAIYSGRYGQIVVDELSGRFVATAREAAHRELPTTRYGMPSTTTERTLATGDVVALSKRALENLIRGLDFPGAAEGRLAVATAIAAHVSNERGHVPVAVDDALPRERVFPWA